MGLLLGRLRQRLDDLAQVREGAGGHVPSCRRVALASRPGGSYRDSVNARILLGLLLVAGCNKTSSAPSTTPPETATTPEPVGSPPDEAETAPLDLSPELGTVEQTMLDLDFVVRFDVESSGALQSRFIGELRAVGDEG